MTRRAGRHKTIMMIWGQPYKLNSDCKANIFHCVQKIIQASNTAFCKQHCHLQQKVNKPLFEHRYFAFSKLFAGDPSYDGSILFRQLPFKRPRNLIVAVCWAFPTTRYSVYSKQNRISWKSEGKSIVPDNAGDCMLNMSGDCVMKQTCQPAALIVDYSKRQKTTRMIRLSIIFNGVRNAAKRVRLKTKKYLRSIP